MAYNKAKEEKKWRLWKAAEERKLRSLGVSEDTIEKLRVYDWAIFNSDRRYYQRVQESGTYLEEVAEDTTPPEIKTVEDFLDSIENQQLFHILIKVDRLTQDRKSSSRSVAKSSAAEVRPPRGSPSRIFWMLPSPQAMPRLPLLLKA